MMEGEHTKGSAPTTLLCRDCKHYRKLAKDCGRPGQPINLVNGRRVFPAIIARGYDELCGSAGKFWERR